MKKIIRISFITCTAVVIAQLFAACDDDTAAIGSIVMPGHDNVTTAQETYTVKTKTVIADSVLANTNDSYLGCVIDPETRAKTTCNFLAQFHVMENTIYPAKDKMLKDSKGNIIIDSCDIRVYINDYYGDSLTTMKLNVQELDTNKIIKENVPYYTNLDANEFLTLGKGVQTAVAYAVKDLGRADSLTDGSTYYRSIVIKLPKEYGSYLAGKYYENPDFYKNAYQFIHHVCPGFYFSISGGVGSMVYAQTSTLNVYFRYHSKNAAGNDTIVDGMQRMAATEEVIQQTIAENNMPESMTSADNPYTYIKSPCGLFTEVELPISDIVAGAHYTDTINSANIVIQRNNSEKPKAYNLDIPSHILMVRKNKAFDFFEKNKLTNNRDSYIANFNTTYNSYTFSNISKLVTLLKNERDAGAGVTVADDEAARNAKYAIWEGKNPDWNKVLLIPVKTESSTTTSSSGTTSSTLLSVKNSLGMSSAKLKGGKQDDVKIDIVYSRFDN